LKLGFEQVSCIAILNRTKNILYGTSKRMKLGECRVGLIGFGAMLQAIYRAWDLAKLIPSSHVLFAQRDAHKAQENQKKFGITSATLATLVEKSQILILGVRPAEVDLVLKSLSSLDLQGKMLLTVVAGLKFKRYQKYLGKDLPLIRAMPNIAASVGSAMTVLSMGPQATLDFQSLARVLFSSMGQVTEVAEPLMDIACAVAGSGPGFVFRLIESMARAGEKEGLPYLDALKMAAQTFYGAAHMVLQGKNPSELIHEIATPGGTTEAGFRVMQEMAIEKSFQKVIEASLLRSQEMGR